MNEPTDLAAHAAHLISILEYLYQHCDDSAANRARRTAVVEALEETISRLFPVLED